MSEYVIVNLFWSFITLCILVTTLSDWRQYRKDKKDEEERHERIHQRAIDMKTKRPDVDYICLICSEEVEPRA